MGGVSQAKHFKTKLCCLQCKPFQLTDSMLFGQLL